MPTPCGLTTPVTWLLKALHFTFIPKPRRLLRSPASEGWLPYSLFGVWFDPIMPMRTRKTRAQLVEDYATGTTLHGINDAHTAENAVQILPGPLPGPIWLHFHAGWAILRTSLGDRSGDSLRDSLMFHGRFIEVAFRLIAMPTSTVPPYRERISLI